jgi:hypothetical protein
MSRSEDVLAPELNRTSQEILALLSQQSKVDLMIPRFDQDKKNSPRCLYTIKNQIPCRTLPSRESHRPLMRELDPKTLQTPSLNRTREHSSSIPKLPERTYTTPIYSKPKTKQKIPSYKGLTISPRSLSTCHCTSFLIIIFVLSLLVIEAASAPPPPPPALAVRPDKFPAVSWLLTHA